MSFYYIFGQIKLLNEFKIGRSFVYDEILKRNKNNMFVILIQRYGSMIIHRSISYNNIPMLYIMYLPIIYITSIIYL